VRLWCALSVHKRQRLIFGLCHTSNPWDSKPVPILLKGICRFPDIGYTKSAMPITPYLAGQAFEPELIREMSLALQSVCDTLKLRLTDDPNTRLVASKIIELAQRGVREAATLSTMTLKEFKHYWPAFTCTTGA
jgi:hypothetical protein